jgi:ankyrin repeat protein
MSPRNSGRPPQRRSWPEVTKVLLEAGSDPQQRNKHGLTPLDCALGGAQGQWQRFSNASLADWRRCVELLRSSSTQENCRTD